MAKSPLRSAGFDELTQDQERELAHPMAAVLAETMAASAFESEEEERRAWEAHGERITREFVAEHPGRRPPGWWRFEASMEGRPLAGSGDIPGVATFEEFREKYPTGWTEETAFLHEAGLLSDAERATLDAAETG